MQSINVVVINPSFLGVLIGTAFLSVAIVILVLLNRSDPSTIFFIGRAFFYLVGPFAVTMFGNVPLNDQLAAVRATDPGAHEIWMHYLERWTTWNHIRTGAAMVAALMFTVGLMRSASA